MSWSDRLAWFIGSGFGSGLSPLAPGSAGSAAAGVIFVAVMLVLPDAWPGYAGVLIFGLLSALGLPLGIWATGRMSTEADPDPGTAVWDEFVGMWITCLPVALYWDSQQPYWVLLPFFVFRALDTLKPWPCRRLEDLHGGSGIMLDDTAAGIMGAVGIWILLAALRMLLN